MENKPYIYKKTIVKTGKHYIGRHNGKNKSYRGSGKYFLRDYKKYVKNPPVDIKTEILEYVNDLSTIVDREEYWIKYFDAFNSPNYYNLTPSGRGCELSTEEFRSMMSKIKKGQKSNRIYTKLSKETKEKISKSKMGTPAWNKGKPNTWTTGKSILQYSLNGKFIKKFNSIRKANAETNIPAGDICKCCKGKYGYAGNYLWFYENLFSKSVLKEKILCLSDRWKSLKKPILKIDSTGNIKEYESMMQAYRETKINNITACLKGKQKTAGKYIWRYK